MSDPDLINSIRAFARDEIAPAAAAIDRERAVPADWWQRLGSFGLTGLTVPAEWGGLGADTATLLAAIEAVAGADGSTGWALLAHLTVAGGIAALGSEEQKQRYLPALARGELLGGTLAGTESGGGSNPGAIRTVARAEGADGDGWRLSGAKFFMTQAGAGDVYLVLAQTAGEGAPKGLSVLIVEKGDAGLGFGARETTMGLHGVEVREMTFADCALPAGRLLGKPAGAMALLGALSPVLVLGASAAALGIAQAAFDATLAHLRARTVAGTPLAQVAGVQGRMAHVAQDLMGARAFLEHAQARLAAGLQGPPLPLWLAKVHITETAERVVSACLGAHGAVGYSEALPLARMLRDVRPFAIHWGNNEVTMDMAGKALLG